MRRILVELRDPALVGDLLRTAGPGRVAERIDIEIQGRAGLAQRRAGREGRAIGHHDFDLVVIGMNGLLHEASFRKHCENPATDDAPRAKERSPILGGQVERNPAAERIAGAAPSRPL